MNTTRPRQSEKNIAKAINGAMKQIEAEYSDLEVKLQNTTRNLMLIRREI